MWLRAGQVRPPTCCVVSAVTIVLPMHARSLCRPEAASREEEKERKRQGLCAIATGPHVSLAPSPTNTREGSILRLRVPDPCLFCTRAPCLSRVGSPHIAFSTAHWRAPASTALNPAHSTGDKGTSRPHPRPVGPLTACPARPLRPPGPRPRRAVTKDRLPPSTESEHEAGVAVPSETSDSGRTGAVHEARVPQPCKRLLVVTTHGPVAPVKGIAVDANQYPITRPARLGW